MGRRPKVEKEILPTMTKEELHAYITQNHRLFTITEIAENTAFSVQQVRTACVNCGVKPITLGERIKSYIENNQHLTLQEQADKLEIEVNSLKHHYRLHGFDPSKAGKGAKLNSTNNIRMGNHRATRNLEQLPIEMLLGPIARSYVTIDDPIELINKARTQLIG